MFDVSEFMHRLDFDMRSLDEAQRLKQSVAPRFREMRKLFFKEWHNADFIDFSVEDSKVAMTMLKASAVMFERDDEEVVFFESPTWCHFRGKFVKLWQEETRPVFVKGKMPGMRVLEIPDDNRAALFIGGGSQGVQYPNRHREHIQMLKPQRRPVSDGLCMSISSDTYELDNYFRRAFFLFGQDNIVDIYFTREELEKHGIL